MSVTVHLVRHGEVENPKGVIYGRLPGYHLSERQEPSRSRRRALGHSRSRRVVGEPLERAQQTAQAIAARHPGLEIVTDERIIESGTTVEGIGRSALAFARSPQHWWHFRNPWGPSWGESFLEIKKRMLDAIEEAVEGAGGREIAIVSHQTPVLVARLALARRRVPPWLAFTPCGTGSVTTLVLEEGKVLSAAYFAPPI